MHCISPFLLGQTAMKEQLKNRIGKVKSYLLRRTAYMRAHIDEDDYRYKLQLIVVSFVLALVAFGMCMLNIVTHKTVLAIATGAFSALSLSVLILARFNKLFFAKGIFGLGIIALFQYFLITGGTDGFSPMWILMLPACGFLVLGMKMGAMISSTMFLLCIIFLWTPLKNLPFMYEYTGTFQMRFPLVYIAFFVVGLIFEYIRHLTNEKLILTNSKLIAANKKITEIAKCDALTGLYNRTAFNDFIEEIIALPKSYAALMLDIDRFKQYNDTYGHLVGDEALKRVAERLPQNTEMAKTFRWGGEEFIVLFPCSDTGEAMKAAEKICEDVKKMAILHEQTDIGVITVSVGVNVKFINSVPSAEDLIRGADAALYRAKENGRDRVELCYRRAD